MEFGKSSEFRGLGFGMEGADPVQTDGDAVLANREGIQQ